MKYDMYIYDECGEWYDTPSIEAADPDEALAAAWEYVHANIGDGDYGQDEEGGARVRVYVTIEDEDGNEVASDDRWVDIEPDHDKLVKRAGGDPECPHEWTSEGEGGCDQNPGVWAVGGTGMEYHSHCRLCGLRRVEYHTGPQFDPGDHDMVEYRLPGPAEEEEAT